MKISGVIITFNEEKKIEACITSMKGIVDEVVVVDSFSTDTTVDICHELGAKVIQQKFLGFRDQKNFAIDQASYDYVLSLDADEVLSETARKSILEEKDKLTHKAYRFNRFNNYCGKWLKHGQWYPDAKPGCLIEGW